MRLHRLFQIYTRGVQSFCPAIIMWSSGYQSFGILREPICIALRNGTTRRRTIRPVGRKQGTLPWDIPPTVSVDNHLFRYTIDGWPTSRSTFAARRLFCPLCEYPIIVCIPRPVVLCVTQTRVRFASDLSGLSPSPPEFNPGHWHQIVANIQDEDSKEQLWITDKIPSDITILNPYLLHMDSTKSRYFDANLSKVMIFI